MKLQRSALFTILLAAVCSLSTGCGKHEAEGRRNAKAGDKPTEKAGAGGSEKNAEPEGRVSHGTNGEAIITLDAETQKRIGLQTAELTSAQYAPEASGFARIQDSSWIGVTITELQAARIAVDAARQELDRLKTLREQNNASEKALQVAQTSAAREENNFRAILIKVQAAWGRKLADLIATYASASRDLNSNSTVAAVGAKPDPLPMQLFGLERVLVRADFPPSAPSLNPEVDVKFFSLAANASPITGTFFDNAPTADPQTQSRGIFYIIDNTNHQFAAGMSLNVAAITAEPVRSGVLVPRDAVLRAQGENWVYVRIAPDKFSRREIKIDQVTDKGLFVVEDLKPGSTVVTTAAQELLSEELKEQ